MFTGHVQVIHTSLLASSFHGIMTLEINPHPMNTTQIIDRLSIIRLNLEARVSPDPFETRILYEVVKLISDIKREDEDEIAEQAKEITGS